MIQHQEFLVPYLLCISCAHDGYYRKCVNALVVVLLAKGNGKTYCSFEQTPDLVSNTMDIIRAQKMEFWLGPSVDRQWGPSLSM